MGCDVVNASWNTYIYRSPAQASGQTSYQCCQAGPLVRSICFPLAFPVRTPPPGAVPRFPPRCHRSPDPTVAQNTQIQGFDYLIHLEHGHVMHLGPLSTSIILRRGKGMGCTSRKVVSLRPGLGLLSPPSCLHLGPGTLVSG